jgi:hypothetical protein
MSTQGPDAASSPSLQFTFDLDRLLLGAAVLDVDSPLQRLLASVPSDVRPALGWLPDLSLTEAAVAVSLNSGATGCYVVVDDPPGTEVASIFLYLAPESGALQTAAGLAISAGVDLGGTPLFGALLHGVAIRNFGVTYASEDFASGAIVLPPGAPAPYSSVPSGLSLAFVVDAGGSAQTFAISTGSSGAGTDSASWTGSGTSAEVYTWFDRVVEDRVRGDTAARAVAATTAAAGPQISWIPVQKSIGPLTVDRIGIVAGTGTLGLALDAELNTDVVNIQLTGFVVAFTPGQMKEGAASVSLDGLAVAVSSPPVEIAGSLLRTEGPSGATEYDGSVLINIPPYAINAVGSYTTVDGAPSLFVFGIVRGQFGGAPWFFVTGLAAGFAVNRALRLPTFEQLATYPLIEAAMGSTGAGDPLSKLNSGGWVPPLLGEYWLAAGICFTSFELLDGFAVLTVQFGKNLTIALLGAAAIQLPTAEDGSFAFAYAEITLEILVEPSAGIFSVEALLTPNSFVIDPSCQLTGGFACDVWFGSNPHAGDFVITLGGYHPDFVKPAWYPSVPRLGFSWHLSDALQLTGESYFALTPSCVMGGGLLDLRFSAGPLRAWFTAQADFIIYWRPFHFDVDVNISIGVSFSTTIFFASVTLTVELGVAVELWGPPLAGIAHVHWWVISFDVAINGGGSSAPAAQTLDSWATFATSSLPAPASICRARAGAGLQTIIDNGTESIWVFGGELIGIATESAIPATRVTVTGSGPPVALPPPAPATAYPPINVYPMGTVTLTSSHQVLIAPWAGADWKPGQSLPAGVDTSGWSWATVGGVLPGALWGRRGTGSQPSLGTETVDAVIGAGGTAEAIIPQGLPVNVAALLIVHLPPRPLPLSAQASGGPGPAATADSRVQIAATINAPTAIAARAAAATAGNQAGLGYALTGGTLTLVAAEIDAVLPDPPMLGPPGTTGPPAAAPAPVASLRPSATFPDTDSDAGSADASPPSLRALFRRDLPHVQDDALQRTGRTARVTVLAVDQWSDNREIRLVQAHHATAVPGVSSTSEHYARDVGLRLGWTGLQTAVWEFPAERASTLYAEGAASLWLVAIDGSQQLVRMETLAPASAHPVAGAFRVAVAVLPDDTDTQAAGWHAGTQLRQMASQTLLGDSVVVRPQSPVGVTRRRSARRLRYRREIGTTTGAQLIDGNWTQGAAGRQHRGWIETHLTSWSQAVTVRLVADGSDESRGAAPPPLLSIQAQSPGQSQPAGLVQPATVEYYGEGQDGIWRFTLPDPPGSTGPLVIRAAAPEGWRLDGLFAFSDASAEWRSWPPTAALSRPTSSRVAEARVWWQ